MLGYGHSYVVYVVVIANTGNTSNIMLLISHSLGENMKLLHVATHVLIIQAMTFAKAQHETAFFKARSTLMRSDKSCNM